MITFLPAASANQEKIIEKDFPPLRFDCQLPVSRGEPLQQRPWTRRERNGDPIYDEWDKKYSEEKRDAHFKKAKMATV